MLYAGFVLINPLLIRVTFVANRGVRGIASLRSIHRSKWARELLSLPSILVPSIERAPLQLQSVLLEHVFTGAAALRARLSRAYMQQLYAQIAALLGSVDALGNPVGFFHDFGDGVKAFFYEPAQGATMGAEEFAKGMGKGSLQLLRGSVFAVFGSASKIVGTIGSGVARYLPFLHSSLLLFLSFLTLMTYLPLCVDSLSTTSTLSRANSKGKSALTTSLRVSAKGFSH